VTDKIAAQYYTTSQLKWPSLENQYPISEVDILSASHYTVRNKIYKSNYWILRIDTDDFGIKMKV